MSKKTTERIICGDNLEILKTIATESVDLCYIDPPFFSGKNYAVIWNDGAEIRQFEDRWVKMGNGNRMSKDINVYLDWMKPRLEEIYRVLKKTGSFYLHCDDHASHYLKMLCDNIFTYERFVNEIIWKRSANSSGISQIFKREHDTILFYSKSKEYIYNMQFKSLSKNTLKNYRYKDKKGIYRLVPLLVSGITKSGETGKLWMGIDPNKRGKSGMHWVCKLKKREQYVKDGLVVTSRTGTPNLKYYLKSAKGVPLNDVWDDISLIQSKDDESTGYPTQKPEALLKRIIKASSNKGDLVLDAFCGCGTTLAVAKRLGRQVIGIDVSPTACRLMAKRINKPKREVEGLPLSPEEIKDLSGWEFQNWINREFGAINGKRGADGGIDGTFEKLLIQVKEV